MYNMPRTLRYIVTLLTTSLCIFIWPSPTQAKTAQILNKSAVEKFMRGKFTEIQTAVQTAHQNHVQQTIAPLLDPKLVALFEFSLNIPQIGLLPAQKAYFQYDPLIDLMAHAGIIDPDGFTLSYEINDFSPQYGGKSAVIMDHGTAKGRIALSGTRYQFHVTQKCRNTIRADAETTLKFESIYCRMTISYQPLNQLGTGLDSDTTLKKSPAINDIINDLNTP